MSTGIVVKAAGSSYTVRDAASGARRECKVRGKLRLRDVRTTNPLTVGDMVTYELGDTPVITALAPRRNYIIRRAANLSKEAHVIAANIDQTFLVVTVDAPPTSLEFIDRFLASAEAYSIPATLLINKIDLYDERRMDMALRMEDTYSAIGYAVLKTSATAAKGDMDRLLQLLLNKVTLLSGISGVGKSSIINALSPQPGLRVGEISGYHNRGKHTTALSEMVEVAKDTYLIDTPGIKGFGLVDIRPQELSHYFREIFAASSRCRFNGCTHVREPGCAVRSAVRGGSISEARYASYRKMMASSEDGKYRR
ncbi:MAG: ribosome small subunit-dependent GTPase A [Prevotellaceae bacterium]|nr:ribosome small subunit-dependent GTPase A [Prevotellaceae bacterium]